MVVVADVVVLVVVVAPATVVVVVVGAMVVVVTPDVAAQEEAYLCSMERITNNRISEHIFVIFLRSSYRANEDKQIGKLIKTLKI